MGGLALLFFIAVEFLVLRLLYFILGIDLPKRKKTKTLFKSKIEKNPDLKEQKEVPIKKSSPLLKKPKEKEKKPKRHKLHVHLEKAGVGTKPEKITKTIFHTAIAISLILSGILIYSFSITLGQTYFDLIIPILTIWTFAFAIIMFLLWIIFYFTIDMKIFQRKQKIEEVFPDYLQLTASNINAGMTIDKALWYAVRPRFGVLAKEIEIVAKETISGVELKDALLKFASKYDSRILQRSISLLIEGMESGGQIGELLNRISLNIQEQRIMFKEMAANVTTYIIFITFASIIASPFLLALSGTLIAVIGSISGGLGDLSNVSASLPLSFGNVGISLGDFQIFSITMLVIGSTFSAMMISAIKKGNVKFGVKYIPVFILISISLYLLSQKVANQLLNIVF